MMLAPLLIVGVLVLLLGVLKVREEELHRHPCCTMSQDQPGVLRVRAC
jgi:hypothetical protein